MPPAIREISMSEKISTECRTLSVVNILVDLVTDVFTFHGG